MERLGGCRTGHIPKGVSMAPHDDLIDEFDNTRRDDDNHGKKLFDEDPERHQQHEEDEQKTKIWEDDKIGSS